MSEKNQIFIWTCEFEICFRLFNIEGLQLIIKPKIQAYDLFYLELLLLSISISQMHSSLQVLFSGSLDQGKSQQNPSK